MNKIEEQLSKLGIELPTHAESLANYLPAKRVGNLVYTAGQVSSVGEKSFKGKLGKEITTEQGKEASQLCVINCLAAIKKLLGSLENVKEVIAVHGMINSVPAYSEQGVVMNGASDFLVSIFGEAGKHTRTAIGVSGLPFNFSVSVYMIVEIEK
jgi:enamine deaminase RidA (YjgF/YER057c/UK114 family)